MKKIYFTPGPSELYFTVEEHIKSALRQGFPSISHRSKAYESVHKSCVDGLKEMFNLSDDYHVFFCSSATEIWERIAQNLIEKESCHFVNGAFSGKFKKIVENYGIHAFEEKVELGTTVDVDKVLIPESAELISLTYNETSTGASYTSSDLIKIREGFPDQLVSLDVVSVAPSIEIDFSLVDTFYFSVQKCFGLPAGLGVWFVNNRCVKKAEQLIGKNKVIGSYHCIPELLSKANNNQTPATPNMLGIYLLDKVVQDMIKKGLKQIRQETNYKSALLNHTVENASFLSHFVPNEVNRSKTTLVVNSNVTSSVIIESLAKKGLVIGTGYGELKNQQIRIANFPTHSKEQIELLSDQILSLNI